MTYFYMTLAAFSLGAAVYFDAPVARAANAAVATWFILNALIYIVRGR